jgi:predicted glycosyltransferase
MSVVNGGRPLRWWVDIANAPHATLFRPIVERLREAGDDVLLTSWDRGQTRALAEEFWPGIVAVGARGFRTPRLAKATAIWDRASALVAVVKPERPDVALGHNSYSQLVAARRLRIPSITMMDYEHQPANHLAFRLASAVVLPEAVPAGVVRRYGATPRKVLRYQGLKEELTLSRFVPAPGFRRSLSLGEDDVVAVVRPAAEGALYHRHRNTLVDAVVTHLVQAGALVLLSPRGTDQADHFGGIDGVRVIAAPVSGADLLYHADLVIGAGGTMTREAAVLGTPVWSMFAGRPAAVDAMLVRQGRLRTLKSPGDLAGVSVVRFRRQQEDWVAPATALDRLDRFEELLRRRATALQR